MVSIVEDKSQRNHRENSNFTRLLFDFLMGRRAVLENYSEKVHAPYEQDRQPPWISRRLSSPFIETSVRV